MRPGRALVLVLAAAVLAPAADAVAATAEVGCTGSRGCTFYYVAFRAGPGETNRVTVSRDGDRRVRVRDTGAPVVPGDQCERVDDHEVVCSIGFSVHAWLGDGDDRFVLVPGGFFVTPYVHAGAGDDRLESRGILKGGQGDDALVGGDGSDELAGGGGRDTLRAGAGDDQLADGDAVRASDADVLEGGGGCDLVSYAGRRRAVVADLRRPRTGERGEGDLVGGVEGAEGGAGADRLTGRRCPGGRGAALAGGGGDDRIFGSSGPDTILPGAGADRVDARAGNDVIDPYENGRRRARDAVRCGAGADTVHQPERPDVTAADCERYRRLGPFDVAWLHGAVRGHRPVFGGAMECFGGRVCRIEVRIVALRSRRPGSPAAGVVLGMSRVGFRGGARRIAVRLLAPAQRALRRAGTVPVRVEIRWTRAELQQVGARQSFETALRYAP